MESGDGKEVLPSVRLIVSSSGEGEEEDVVLTDLILQQDFEK